MNTSLHHTAKPRYGCSWLHCLINGQCVPRYDQTRSKTALRSNSQARYQETLPERKTVSKLVSNLNNTGNVENRNARERPPFSDWAVETVNSLLLLTPHKVPKESSCGLWDSIPCNTEHTVKTSSYFFVHNYNSTSVTGTALRSITSCISIVYG